MMKFFLVLLLISCGFSLIYAQENQEKQKLRIEFLQKILTDARSLQRPENRAFIYAKIGSVLWQTDEKFARKLFQDSINEVIAAQNEMQNYQDSRGIFQELIYGQSPRWQILFLIANKDAEFALDAMNRSRPAKISQVLKENLKSNQWRTRQFATTEMQNEQRLIAIVADQSPERAVRLLRENMKKNISYESLNLLRKISQKDAALANNLAEEIAQQLLSKDLIENNDELGNFSYFLSVFLAQQKSGEGDLKISDKTIRDMASKLLDALLDPNVNYYNHENNAEYFEKNFPDRFVKLKAKIERQSGAQQTPQQKEYSKLMQSDVSATELLSQADKFPRDLRREIYRQAAGKFAESGNLEQAQQIFKEYFSDEETGNYLSNYAANLAYKAVSKENFGEAYSLIEQIPNKYQKINVLANVASTVFNKNRDENKQQAISILEQARALLPDAPECSDDMNSMSYIATQYGEIEPERAFSIIEQLIGPLDELSQANAVIAKYNGYTNYRLGEFQIGSGSSAVGVSGFENTLNTLKNKNFERVLQISNGFSRPEVRLSLQINLIEDNNIINLPISGRIFFSNLR